MPCWPTSPRPRSRPRHSPAPWPRPTPCWSWPAWAVAGSPSGWRRCTPWSPRCPGRWPNGCSPGCSTWSTGPAGRPLSGDALLPGAGAHRLRDGRGHPAVEGAGDDVVGPHLVADDVRDRGRRGELRLLGDAGRAGVDGAAEDAGEGEHVVDLVGQVAAAGGHHGGVLRGRVGVDL